MTIVRRTLAIAVQCLVAATAAAQVPPGGSHPIPSGGMARIDRRPPGPAPVVRLTALGPTTVKIMWTPVPGIQNYEIARAGPSGNAAIPVSVAATDAPLAAGGSPMARAGAQPTIRPRAVYVDGGRAPNAQYVYYVTALQPQTSQYSAGTSAGTTITMPPGIPPAALTLSVVGPRTVALTWQGAPDASGYLIIRDNAVITTQPVRGTSYTDTGVGDGMHRYRVVAYYRVDGQGEVEGDVAKSPSAQVVLSRCPGMD